MQTTIYGSHFQLTKDLIFWKEEKPTNDSFTAQSYFEMEIE